ncbi:hypothetical protein SAMN05421736_12514 [Evansella caseinilytica]|uniref:Uncharacterized protein n=1 Tax=Evansella caseinilytica TaxID=1503961 RepID=A0A1H3URN5_9BACI|nr:hypothetical protein [Evansella caseinilytica]SDZ65103.1 hypothetical protein SAMN05421736_12514 [Evansella caseinilytica]
MLLLTLALVIPLNFVKAEKITEDEEEILNSSMVFETEEMENLKSLGFTEDEIVNMSQEEYDLNKDLKGEIISSETKYYKVYEYIEDKNQLFNINSLSTQDDHVFTEIELSKEQYYNELAQIDETDAETGFFQVASSAKSVSKSKKYVL